MRKTENVILLGMPFFGLIRPEAPEGTVTAGTTRPGTDITRDHLAATRQPLTPRKTEVLARSSADAP